MPSLMKCYYEEKPSKRKLTKEAVEGYCFMLMQLFSEVTWAPQGLDNPIVVEINKTEDEGFINTALSAVRIAFTFWETDRFTEETIRDLIDRMERYEPWLERICRSVDL